VTTRILLQILYGGQVAFCKVHNVDVVAHASAVYVE
jgi:hypothetical protein